MRKKKQTVHEISDIETLAYRRALRWAARAARKEGTRSPFIVDGKLRNVVEDIVRVILAGPK